MEVRDENQIQLCMDTGRCIFIIVEAISLSRTAALEIAASDPDPDVVHAVNFLLEASELLLQQIKGPPR